MKDLSKFFSVLQLTREQVQYGYFLAGVTRQETSNLAEHQYLVAMIGWLLCEYINGAEKLIEADEVIKLCLIHDLGELFGGDMAAPLSRKRPDIKKHAQAFERGNLEIILSLLNPKTAERLEELWEKEEARATDEAVVAKIADLIETHFFLEHRNKQYAQKDAFYANHIRPLADKISDERVRTCLHEFFKGFEMNIQNKGFTACKWILE